MRILPPILTASLLLALTACVSSTTPSDARPANGSCTVNRFAVGKDRPTTFHLGGITFQVTKDLITWDRGGSLPLEGDWRLLELHESPTAVAINLDGRKLADVKK